MPSPYFDNYGMVAVTAATLSVIAGAHVGSRINLNRAAGIAVTLPKATGSGNRYEFIVQATVTGSTTIKVVDSVDVMTGLGYVLGAAAASFATVAASDTITMNGTTTGGITRCKSV